MSILEKSTDLLKDLLLKQNKPVTYKLLSRSLDVSVTDAKKLLYTFYNSHKDDLQPFYLIIGQPRDSVEQTVVKVTSDLEDQSSFANVDSVQVYSLSAKNIKVDEVSQMVFPELDKFEVTEEKMSKWGLIRGPDFVKVEKPSIEREVKKEAKKEVKEEKEVKNEKTEKTEKKNAFPDMTSQASRILAKYKKEEPKKKDTQRTFGKSLGVATKKKPAETVDPVVEKEKTQKQKELESMFDDDDDIMEIDEIEPEVKEPVQKEHVKEPEPKKEVLNDDLEGIFDSSFSQSQSQPDLQEKPEETTETKKNETTSYIDDDGYMVINKVETKTKPKPARSSPAASSQPTKKQKTGVKQQSSLASFFGKKK